MTLASGDNVSFAANRLPFGESILVAWHLGDKNVADPDRVVQRRPNMSS